MKEYSHTPDSFPLKESCTPWASVGVNIFRYTALERTTSQNNSSILYQIERIRETW